MTAFNNIPHNEHFAIMTSAVDEKIRYLAFDTEEAWKTDIKANIGSMPGRYRAFIVTPVEVTIDVTVNIPSTEEK